MLHCWRFHLKRMKEARTRRWSALSLGWEACTSLRRGCLFSPLTGPNHEIVLFPHCASALKQPLTSSPQDHKGNHQKPQKGTRESFCGKFVPSSQPHARRAHGMLPFGVPCPADTWWMESDHILWPRDAAQVARGRAGASVGGCASLGLQSETPKVGGI